MSEKLLTPEEVAARLSVSTKSIRHWIRTHKLKGVKVGRLWRVRDDDLKRFLMEPDENEVKPRQSALGLLSGLPGSVDDFLRNKHAENEEEERRWEDRHKP